jgi:hypothetical protein
VQKPAAEPPPAAATAPLPEPRGELTGSVLTRLLQPPHDLARGLDRLVWNATEDDLQLALYCMYELHYTGFPEVDPEWEWEPSLLRLRRAAEDRFESELRDEAGAQPSSPDDIRDELWELASAGGGPSLSEWVRERATLGHVRELFKHRSPYQLKEADPHTWAIPHVRGPAKAVLAAIQHDEYGSGSGADMHSSLFADTLEAVGLDAVPNAYLDETPGWTLATTNLISLLGLHRRLRGCLVGHLALFEMTSTGPMGRYSDALRRLGLPAEARRFFDVHVVADEHHQHMAADGMVGGLVRTEPHLAGDVLLGARFLSVVERRFAREVLGAWTEGRSSLLEPGRSSLPTAGVETASRPPAA